MRIFVRFVTIFVPYIIYKGVAHTSFVPNRHRHRIIFDVENK